MAKTIGFTDHPPRPGQVELPLLPVPERRLRRFGRTVRRLLDQEYPQSPRKSRLGRSSRSWRTPVGTWPAEPAMRRCPYDPCSHVRPPRYARELRGPILVTLLENGVPGGSVPVRDPAKRRLASAPPPTAAACDPASGRRAAPPRFTCMLSKL